MGGRANLGAVKEVDTSTLNVQRTATFNGDVCMTSSDATTAGRIISDNTQDALTTLDGSIQTDGGISVAKTVVVGTAVGIGTSGTAPEQALHVKEGNIRAEHLILQNQTGSPTVDLPIATTNKVATISIYSGDGNDINSGPVVALIKCNNDAGNTHPFLDFRSSRSTADQLAAGTFTAVADNDDLGAISIGGDDGTDIRYSGVFITGTVDTTLESVAANRIPVHLRFRVIDRAPITLETNNVVRQTISGDGLTTFTGRLTTDDTTAATSTTNGSLQTDGGISAAGAVYAGGRITTDDTTAATSTTNGSLQTDGGISAAGAVFVGGAIETTSNLSSSSATTGSIVAAGGIGIAGDMHINNNVFFDTATQGISYSGVTTTASQASSNSNTVTLECSVGAITMNTTVAAGATDQFVLSNAAVSTTSIVIATVQGISTTGNIPTVVSLDAPGSGTIGLNVYNADGSNATTAAPVIHFMIIDA